MGRGASAEVWLARRAVLPGALKPCALKVIHGRIARQPRHREMFFKEARLALKMSHANLVSVFDAGEASGRLFMALEWVDGLHLRAFAERARAHGSLSIEEVCYIVDQILQGLRHAHGMTSQGRPLGVVHRDVAPHNVMVSAAGEIKLGDFGIARIGTEMSSGEHVKGRARYMAPEQLFGEPGPASDLFSVGAILHELLEGRRFREGLERSTCWHRTVAEATVPALRRRGVPPTVEALRVGLLQPDPRRRIGTTDEALAWLQRCPPWSHGAATLRSRYERCVGLRRRTGLTRPLPAVPPTPAIAPRPAPSWSPVPSLPPMRSLSPLVAKSPVCSDSSSQPTIPCVVVPAVASRPPRPRRRPPLPVVLTRPRPTEHRRSARGPGWRATWGTLVRPLVIIVGVILALVALGLAVAPRDRSSAACIVEPVAVDPAQRTWLRLRGDA
ncbi:MAG: protein kinase, partial [Nannocystaceae bacterium]